MNIHDIIKFLISIKLFFKETPAKQEFSTNIQTDYGRLIIELSSRQQNLLHLLLIALIDPSHHSTLWKMMNRNGKSLFEQKELLEITSDIIMRRLAALAHTFEKSGTPIEQAKKLSIMCGDLESALDYLNTYYLSKKTAMHTKSFDNACAMLCPILDTSTWDVKTWRALAKQNHWKHLVENSDFNQYILPAAAKIEEALKKLPNIVLLRFPFNGFEEQKELTEAWVTFRKKLKNVTDPKELSKSFQTLLMQCPTELLLNEYYKATFPSAEQNIIAAKIFNQYPHNPLHIYLSLTPQDSDVAIPDIIIDENTLEFETNYYLLKLDSFNPIAGVLGEITNCCQTLGKEFGDALTRYAICDPNCGFYVIYKREGKNPNVARDSIVAETIAIRTGTMLVLHAMVGKSKIGRGNITIENCPYQNIDVWKAQMRILAQTFIKNPMYGVSKVLTGIDAPSTFKNLGLSGGKLLQPDEFPAGCPIGVDYAELAIQNLPLYELYILSQNTPLKPRDEKIARETLCQYIHSSEGFKTLCQLISECDPSSYALSVMYTLHHLLEEMSIGKENDLDLLAKKQALQDGLKQQFNSEKIEAWLARSMHVPLSHFQWWIETFNIPLNTQWKNHPTSLHLAVYYIPNPEILEYLINKLNDKALFYVKGNSVTPLMQTIHKRDLESLQCLINAKCDVFHSSHTDTIPILVWAANNARANRYWDIMQYLWPLGGALLSLDPPNFNEVLALALECKQNDMIKTAIKNRWISWHTLSPNILKELIPHLDFQDEVGNTALHNFLIDSVRIQSDDNARASALNAVKLLIQNDVDLNKKNHVGMTALHFMASIQQLNALISICLFDRIALDIPNKNGNTALHILAENQQWALVKQLVMKNASFDLKNHAGKTVLDIVTEKGELTTLLLLQQKQASVLNAQPVLMHFNSEEPAIPALNSTQVKAPHKPTS